MRLIAANNNDSEQTAQICSLLRIIVVRIKSTTQMCYSFSHATAQTCRTNYDNQS